MASLHELAYPKGIIPIPALLHVADFLERNNLQRDDRLGEGLATEMQGIELEAIIRAVYKKHDRDPNKVPGLLLSDPERIDRRAHFQATPVSVHSFRLEKGVVRRGIWRSPYSLKEIIVLAPYSELDSECFIPKILQTIEIGQNWPRRFTANAVASPSEADLAIEQAKAAYDHPRLEREMAYPYPA